MVSAYPANGATFSPRTSFEATWTLKNTGSKEWDRNSVDFLYDSGDKIHKVSSYDLEKTVKPGQNITLSASMQAPKTSANYTTYWVLRVGNTYFCKLTVYIFVQ